MTTLAAGMKPRRIFLGSARIDGGTAPRGKSPY
jgi:hypothetical protein